MHLFPAKQRYIHIQPPAARVNTDVQKPLHLLSTVLMHIAHFMSTHFSGV
jgi:hypothetical protein